MISFNLNGRRVNATENLNLLDYLREEARLTSVKNGCSQGVCGSCTLIIDGEAKRACTLTLSRVQDKTVLTLEGLMAEEKEIYAAAFAEAGAVQCGFCIPGMVMAAKALLDKTLTPSSEDIRNALKYNLCRCTGYAKIIQGVQIAAAMLRQEITSPKVEEAGLGVRLPRVDAREKVLGTGEYVDDLQVEGMLHAAVLRSKYPRALIRSIDTRAAKVYPGVVAVLTADDVPGNRYWGMIIKDWPAQVAVGEETRYIGEALALVAATNQKIAREALALIRIQYEELEPLISPAQALDQAAAKIHPGGNILSTTAIRRGDSERALAEAKYIITQKYSTPPTEHAFLEPESALAVPDGAGGLRVYVSSQSVFEDCHGIASILGLPTEKVRVIGKLVGGGFGGKEDLSVQHHAALLAFNTGKPVKLTLSRQESFLVHPKRHAMETEITTGCDENGKITVIKARVTADTGAYASLGGPVLQRACTHLAGPYQVPNVDIEGISVYTNNPPGGAFRGFGVPQSIFGAETNLDLLAEKVGLSPWEIRYLNALEPGATMATGQIADAGTAIKETLLAVKNAYESSPYAGIACAMKNTGLGVGVPDIGRAKLKVKSGRVTVLSSAACIGQGLATVLIQIVSETTGISVTDIVVATPDTAVTPDAGTTTASRQTLFTGEAVKRAAEALMEDLCKGSLADMEGREYYGEFIGQTDPLNSNKSNPLNHVAYSYATQVVILDEQGYIQKVVAAHDVGKAVNPINIEGQIEGGVAMGLGYALTEDFPLQKGVPTVKFGTLGLFRAPQMPEIESIIIEKNSSSLAFGAKGVGEITTIPTAPAVASAYYRFDGQVRLRLPLQDTPYRTHPIIKHS